MDRRSSWRSGPWTAARLAPVVLVALFAATLVLPTALAQDGAAELPAAAPLAQATPADALPVETQLQPEDQSGIFLNIFDCPGRFGGDHQALLENCTAALDIVFDIFGPNLQLSSTGGIALERLPAGLYRIREYRPAGYGDPSAFCVIGPTYQQPAGWVPVIVYDGYYEFELGQGQAIFCDWFNISPQAPADSATILLNKHFCRPPAVFDAYSATIYELAPNCQEPPFPVPFSVTKDGVRIDGGTAIGAPNLLTFDGLPVGDVTIIETMPDGYDEPLVFCSVKDEFGAARAALAQATVDNDRAFWQLNAGDVVFCDWFNVPAPLGTTITVIKFTCPDAISYDLMTSEEYAAACTQLAANVSFKLDGASTGNPGEQLTDATGQVTWSEMEADRYYLTEEVPSGFGPPVVFCSYYDPAAMQSRDYQRYAVSSENRIEFGLADGQNIACSWFNISDAWAGTAPVASPQASPATDDPSASPAPTSAATQTPTTGPAPAPATSVLAILLHRCQPGYDYLATNADPTTDCLEPVDDVSFELATAGGGAGQARRRADIGGARSDQATFTGIAPGDYRLTPVNYPAGNVAFILSCISNQRDFSSYPFVPFAVGGADGSISLSIVADEALICDWYEVPGGNAD